MFFLRMNNELIRKKFCLIRVKMSFTRDYEENK